MDIFLVKGSRDFGRCDIRVHFEEMVCFIPLYLCGMHISDGAVMD